MIQTKLDKQTLWRALGDHIQQLGAPDVLSDFRVFDLGNEIVGRIDRLLPYFDGMPSEEIDRQLDLVLADYRDHAWALGVLKQESGRTSVRMFLRGAIDRALAPEPPTKAPEPAKAHDAVDPLPRHFRIALANATRAITVGNWSALGSINEDLQPLIDAMLARISRLEQERDEARKKGDPAYWWIQVKAPAEGPKPPIPRTLKLDNLTAWPNPDRVHEAFSQVPRPAMLDRVVTAAATLEERAHLDVYFTLRDLVGAYEHLCRHPAGTEAAVRTLRSLRRAVAKHDRDPST